jgi:hypothetical protein
MTYGFRLSDSSLLIQDTTEHNQMEASQEMKLMPVGVIIKKQAMNKNME